VKEFRWLTLEGMADELKNPSQDEQTRRIQPQLVNENTGDKKWQRKQDSRNTQGVTDPVHRMLMTGTILRDPLLVSASAQHAEDNNTI